MSKNILLMSYHFFPSGAVGAKRFIYLSKYLKEFGNKIFTLTVKDKYYEITDESIFPNGNVYRTRMIPRYPIIKTNIINKAWNRVWEKFAPIDAFVGHLILGLIKGSNIIKKNNIDIIIVTGPPFSFFLTAYFLAKLKKKRLIIDYRDPWIFYQDRKPKFYRVINKFIEKKILYFSNGIVFNTNYSKKAYCKEFSSLHIENKSFVITNAFENRKNLEPVYLEKNKKVILYAGNFYGDRNLNYLLKPILRLIKEDIILKQNIIIHVFGEIKEDDLNFIKQYDLEDLVKKHQFDSYENILKYMKGSNILYLPQGNDVKYSIAYKFYDYLSVKKPILAVVSNNSAISEIMGEIDCGEVADISNDESIYSSLKILLTEEKQYNYKGFENYTWENISKNYNNLIQNF